MEPETLSHGWPLEAELLPADTNLSTEMISATDYRWHLWIAARKWKRCPGRHLL